MGFPLPTEKQGRILWISITTLAVGILLALLGLFFWGIGWVINQLSTVLLPVAVAGVIAYLLDPVVDYFVTLKMPRLRAVLLVFCLALMLVLGLLWAVVPRIANEANALAQSLPEYSEKFRKKVNAYMANPPLGIKLPWWLRPWASISTEFDLNLISVENVTQLPQTGEDVVVIADVNNRLHFRIFDSEGKIILNDGESELPQFQNEIDQVRKDLGDLWNQPELSDENKADILKTITPISDFALSTNAQLTGESTNTVAGNITTNSASSDPELPIEESQTSTSDLNEIESGENPPQIWNTEFGDKMLSWMPKALQTLPAVGKWLVNQAGKVASWAGLLIGLSLVPIYAFYFLLEKRGIERNWTDYLPIQESKIKDELVFVLHSINSYLILFFRGQVLVALCDGILYTVGFLIVGLPFAFLIGLIAGLLTIVPYLGFVISLVPALVLATVQYGDWLHPLLTLSVFAVVQTAEGLYISPKIMGDRVGLHPLTIIIAVMVGTTLMGGIIGGILAIPLTAALRVLMFRYVWKKRTDSHN